MVFLIKSAAVLHGWADFWPSGQLWLRVIDARHVPVLDSNEGVAQIAFLQREHATSSDGPECMVFLIKSAAVLHGWADFWPSGQLWLRVIDARHVPVLDSNEGVAQIALLQREHATSSDRPECMVFLIKSAAVLHG